MVCMVLRPFTPDIGLPFRQFSFSTLYRLYYLGRLLLRLCR